MSGRSFSIPMQSTSERSSTKTALPPLGQIHCWTDTLCRLGMLPMLTLIKRRVTVKKIALLLLAGVSLVSTNVAAQGDEYASVKSDENL